MKLYMNIISVVVYSAIFLLIYYKIFLHARKAKHHDLINRSCHIQRANIFDQKKEKYACVFFSKT